MADEERSRTAEILLVEANLEDAEAMRAAFREVSVQCHLNVLRTGKEALQLCRGELPRNKSARPDLVLLDLRLPDMPGLKVLEAMKGHEALRRIPVVVLSATENRAEISKAYHLGANSFILKPADPAGYIRMVKGVDDFWLTVVMLPKD